MKERPANSNAEHATAEDQPELVVKSGEDETGANEARSNESPADGWSNEDESQAAESQPEFPDLGDRYKVVERIGQGGMGSVYKVLDKETGMTVAIKSLQGALAKDATALKRFKMETDAASQLTHPNLISVLGRGTTRAGTPYIVMEYLEGRSLAAVLADEGCLSPERAVNLFMQISEGLAYVHEKGIIHRDIKPTNVILTKNGDVETARLVDFGIATILPSGTRETVDLTKTGDVFGSPQYMSPEQCLGFLLDQRSDVYSFGCLMYEVVTGHPPFSGNTPVQLVVEHINSEAPSFSGALKTNKTIAKLEGIILRCLEKEQALRFQSASELLADLALVKSGKSVPKYVKSSKVKPILTKRQALGALAVVCVGLYYLPRLSFWSYDISHQLGAFVQLLICSGGSWAFLSVGLERLRKLRGKTATPREWSFSIALCSIGLLGCSMLPYLIMNTLSTRYGGASMGATYIANGFFLQEIEEFIWTSALMFWSSIVGGSFAIVTVLASIVGVLSITGKKTSAAVAWIRIGMMAVFASSILFFGFPDVASKVVHFVAVQGERAYPDVTTKLVRLASQLDKNDTDSLWTLVRVEMNSKKYQDAIDTINEVLRRTKGHEYPLPYMELADLHMKLEQYVLAEAAASKAISVSPKSTMSYNLRGEIRLKRNDFAGALSDFETSIKLSPGGENAAHLKRVGVYCAQKKWEPALSALEDIITIARLSPAAYVMRGIIYQHLDREDLAEYDFECALSEYVLGRESSIYYGPQSADRNLIASFAFKKLGKTTESTKALQNSYWYRRGKNPIKEWNSDLLKELKSQLGLDDAKIPVEL